MILYKYRTDSEWTVDILKNKKVWFAKPDTLNDPLECSIQEISEINIKKCCEQEKREQIEGFVLAYVMTNENKLMWGLPKKRIKQVLSRIGNTNDFDEKYRIFAQFIQSRTGNFPSNPESKYLYITDILKNVGVFSLSETCTNELMWGHYADGGKGIAIGFEIVGKSGITPNSICLKVNYTNEALILKDRIKPVLAFSVDKSGNPLFFQSVAFDDPFFKSAMSTKNTTWSYEKEWRCVEQMYGVKKINSPIAEIVFGLKCPLDIRKKYIALANEFCGESIRFFEIVLTGRMLVKKPLTIN